MKRFASLVFTLSLSCVTTEPSQSTLPADKANRSVPFRYFDETFIAIPVTINDSLSATFILDTGIGINLISKTLCQKLVCQVTGTHTGKRMSGQELTIPMASVSSMSIAGYRKTNVPIGIFDMERMMPGSGIDGFISLGFFRDVAFSVNYKQRELSLEDEGSLRELKSQGKRVPIKLNIKGQGVGVSMPIVLPNGQQIAAEVDTGSQALILDERFMGSLGISSHDAAVRRKDGKDETGHAFTRYFTKLKGRVHMPNAPEIGMDSLDVMFQKIIYEGLLGHYFLSQFRVTYNLPGSEMIFNKD